MVSAMMALCGGCTRPLVTSSPCSRYHLSGVASNILSPWKQPTSMRRIVMMSCSSAYRRMKGQRSLRGQTDVFKHRLHSDVRVMLSAPKQPINPNMVPSHCCDVIVHRTWRRRGKAASSFTTGKSLAMSSCRYRARPLDNRRNPRRKYPRSSID